ncbi:hypothetical protein [Paenibacillus thiaminolyticus]|uniref:hypothetical protein n=1 Tax=Paenibacillus thiaminolyticus TaxID=49283 RepID=UPI0025435D0E|nr:hypothetical protein [Paenibacillus thiaminolyticus]WII38196.1 hypothetical protein O0V01_03355 [Paenibacillus thiaminolyticus]
MRQVIAGVAEGEIPKFEHIVQFLEQRMTAWSAGTGATERERNNIVPLSCIVEADGGLSGS